MNIENFDKNIKWVEGKLYFQEGLVCKKLYIFANCQIDKTEKNRKSKIKLDEFLSKSPCEYVWTRTPAGHIMSQLKLLLYH